MAKYPYGKKTTLKEEDMEQVKAEDDPEPLRSESMDAQVDEPRLVDTETADAFHRLEERDRMR
eukprot:10121578-Karenia_brevis.AAC.1